MLHSERKGLIFLILYNANLQDRAVLVMWSEKFSLSSITTPRFLAVFEGAFNVNKHVHTIYLLLRIYFAVNYIYLKIHHHHVDMLCYLKSLTTNMSSNILNCCVYRAAADTFINDFTWIHCASCLFNTARFIFMLLLIGLTFLTHPPNKRKDISNPVVHRFKETCRSNPETVAKSWAPVWTWTWPCLVSHDPLEIILI